MNKQWTPEVLYKCKDSPYASEKAPEKQEFISFLVILYWPLLVSDPDQPLFCSFSNAAFILS